MSPCPRLQPNRKVASRAASILRGIQASGLAGLLLAWSIGCSPGHYRKTVDRNAYSILEEKQMQAFGETEPFSIDSPADQLRERLLLEQLLPVSHPGSMGSRHLTEIDHWPTDEYLRETEPTLDELTVPATNGVVLTLVEALQVAARNSRDFQSVKEDVFRSALDLDLERNEYRTTFTGFLNGNVRRAERDLRLEDVDNVNSAGGGAGFGVTQRLRNGSVITMEMGWDVIRLLEPGEFTSESAFGDASISIPLLRGSGSHIAAEPLKQAERNVIYALYDFETFKRSFAVSIAGQYLSVLQRQNAVQNAEENYRGLIASSRRAQRLLDAGDLPAIQVDQSLQNELSARNNWVSALASYASALDAFKVRLGIPTDANIQLSQDELSNLNQRSSAILEGASEIEYEEDIPPADAEIVLEPPTGENAGPLEMLPEEAVQLAFENRLDLTVAKGRVYDAQRKVVVAADGLRPELTLFGNARLTFIEADDASSDIFSDLEFDARVYDAFLNLDLPLERTQEAVTYRNSLINLERSVRNLQQLEDNIKLDIFNSLRTLREARESLRIQALSVTLAQRRVRSANLFLQAGRAQIRDLLEAQEDLLSAQNSLTAATVNYRVAELQLQQDLGVLEVSNNGLWREFTPGQAQTERTDYETSS